MSSDVLQSLIIQFDFQMQRSIMGFKS